MITMFTNNLVTLQLIGLEPKLGLVGLTYRVHHLVIRYVGGTVHASSTTVVRSDTCLQGSTLVGTP